MRVALAGGTGFTGRRVAARLASRGDTLRCLVRAASDTSVLPADAETVEGDLGDVASLSAWLSGCETLVYTASMGFGHVPGVVAAAEGAGLRRAVFVSTTAIFTRLPAPSKVVRTAAEESVTGSALEWTIVRPTMIYGAPGDRNMERLLRYLARWPLVPLPGSGRSLIQPVHVDDLADGIAAATHCTRAVGRAFDLSGADALAFRDAIAVARRALSTRCLRVGIPLAPVVACLRLLEAAGLRPPIKSEQVLRLAEDKAFAHDEAARAFGYAPRSFAAGITEEAALLGLVRGGGRVNETVTLMLIAGAAVTAVSFVGVRLVLSVARRKELLDHPNERSSHSIPTPSGGGVGLAGAIALALPFVALYGAAPQLLWVLPAVVVACGLGIYDDARPLGARAKLVALALAGAPVLGAAAADLVRMPYLDTFSLAWASVPLTVFWLTGYANAFNFMDGIDGIAGITAAVSGAVFAVAGALAGDAATALTGTLVVGASVGFLPANFPRARIFMGDAGSLPLGILLAASALLAADDHGVVGTQAMSFPASVLLLGPFLFDVVFTLVRRAARGARLGEAHREHLYQRLARRWGAHPAVSLLYGGFALVTGALALGYDRIGELGKLVSLTLPLLTMLLFAAAVLRADRPTETSRPSD